MKGTEPVGENAVLGNAIEDTIRPDNGGVYRPGEDDLYWLWV